MGIKLPSNSLLAPLVSRSTRKNPVSILAVIARLFKDSGIITNTNQTDIFNFFTSHFVNQQKKDFSYEHLRTRYYQVEERTKEKAYDYLMMMAQLCKKL